MSGSAATRHVSSSFSESSRAVANSGPRPITSIRPTKASCVATGRKRGLELGQELLEQIGSHPQAVDVRRALAGGMRGEQRHGRHLGRVGLGGGNRPLLAGQQRQHSVGDLGQRRVDVVGDRDRVGATSGSPFDVVDDVGCTARLRQR